MDIDHFKRVNGTHGHVCGHSVLQHVSAILKAFVRPYDTVDRYGGEEFLVVVPESDAVQAFNIAERIRKAIESQPVAAPLGQIRVRASSGVAASASSDTAGPQALLNLADEAGRNRTERASDSPPSETAPLAPALRRSRQLRSSTS
jgi:diguanylate cyclase (GGDEF)-like protein